MSWITDKALLRIREQKERIEKIEDLQGRLSECGRPTASEYSTWERYANDHAQAGDMDLILQSLDVYASTIQADVQRRERAIECGSEDGNLQSHSEKKILEGCISILFCAGAAFREHLDFIGMLSDEGEEKLSVTMNYGEIVNRLFLWGTKHSGGTSTAAKCRELGVDYYESFNICEEDEEAD